MVRQNGRSRHGMAQRLLKNGKEAVVYVVRCGEEIGWAKVYKQANKRTALSPRSVRPYFKDPNYRCSR